MGTSKSSSGAPSGVPLVPPWVPDPPLPSDPDYDQSPPPLQISSPIAPSGRFSNARRSLGRFTESGSMRDMKRGLKHYVRTGLGGSSIATRRFAGTARTAGVLYGALSSTATGRALSGKALDPQILAGRSATEIMDAVVETVRTVDGTQDTEASRKAIRDSLSDLLSQFPDADLLNLSVEQRLFVIERFIAIDIYNRIILDIGKTINEKAHSAITALSRMKQIRDYVRETIAVKFRMLRRTASALSAAFISQVTSRTMYEAFTVFEDYVK
jgi:hypothetical protein